MTDPLVSFLRDRWDEEERDARAATQGRWFWAEPSQDSWPCGDEELMATQDVWERCPYFCSWTGVSSTSRGEPGRPGHEHLVSEVVVGSWGHDAYGVTTGEADQRHIVRHSPSRVLAEVEAKRAVLDLHRCDTFLTHVDGHRIELDPPYVCDTCGGHPEAPTVGVWPCPTVLALARPYVDHPAYDPVWAATAPS